MKKNLEQFINNNRDQFDSEMPGKNVWANLEARLSSKKKKRFVIEPYHRWNVAAAVLLIIFASVFYFKSVQPAIINDGISEGMVPLEKEYNNKLRQFVQLIDLKQEELRKTAADQPELYNSFTEALDQLDSSYNALKTKLAVTPNREMLMDAMVENLELQLNIINQQLNIIHQIKEQKKDSHEKKDKAI